MCWLMMKHLCIFGVHWKEEHRKRNATLLLWQGIMHLLKMDISIGTVRSLYQDFIEWDSPSQPKWMGSRQWEVGCQLGLAENQCFLYWSSWVFQCIAGAMRPEPVERCNLIAYLYFMPLNIFCRWNNIKQANTCKSCHLSYFRGLR